MNQASPQLTSPTSHRLLHPLFNVALFNHLPSSSVSDIIIHTNSINSFRHLRFAYNTRTVSGLRLPFCTLSPTVALNLATCPFPSLCVLTDLFQFDIIICLCLWCFLFFFSKKFWLPMHKTEANKAIIFGMTNFKTLKPERLLLKAGVKGYQNKQIKVTKLWILFIYKHLLRVSFQQRLVLQFLC